MSFLDKTMNDKVMKEIVDALWIHRPGLAHLDGTRCARMTMGIQELKLAKGWTRLAHRIGTGFGDTGGQGYRALGCKKL